MIIIGNNSNNTNILIILYTIAHLAVAVQAEEGPVFKPCDRWLSQPIPHLCHLRLLPGGALVRTTLHHCHISTHSTRPLIYCAVCHMDYTVGRVDYMVCHVDCTVCHVNDTVCHVVYIVCVAVAAKGSHTSGTPYSGCIMLSVPPTTPTQREPNVYT
jgi:hypothetical protein